MNILICDDDAAFAGQCKAKLCLLAKKNDIDINVSLVPSGEQLLFYLNTKFAKVDLIYLDYHMPGTNGIETALTLRRHNVVADIVFCTADEGHAVEGYDVDALHYLVKDKMDDDKFDAVFLKAAKRIKKRTQEMIYLSCAGERRNIAVEDISYFEVQKRIITVHYAQTESFGFYSTLSKLEELLCGKGFLRIHQFYLVSEKHIRKRKVRTVEMDDKAILPVGRSYQGRL